MSSSVAQDSGAAWLRGQFIFSKLLSGSLHLIRNEAVEQCKAPLGDYSQEMNLGVHTSSLVEPEPARSPEGRQRLPKGILAEALMYEQELSKQTSTEEMWEMSEQTAPTLS